MGLRQAGLVRVAARRAMAAPGSSGTSLAGITGLVKAANGTPSAAVAGTDYVAPAGVAGGQTIAGGTGMFEALTLTSTTHGAKGVISTDSPIRGSDASTGARLWSFANSGTNAGYVDVSDSAKTKIGFTGNTLAVFDGTDVTYTSGGAHKFVFGGSEQLRLSSNGNALLGTTTDVASTKLRVVASKTVASAAGAVWDALDVAASTLTLSGATNVTTATGVNLVVVRQPTITSSSALTVTAAASLVVAAAPLAAGSATITNAYSIWVQAGTSVFDGPIKGTSTTNGARIWSNNNTGTNSGYLQTNDSSGTTIAYNVVSIALDATNANFNVAASGAYSFVHGGGTNVKFTLNGNALFGTTSDVASSRVRIVASKTVASAAGAVWDGFSVAASTLTLTGTTSVTTANGVNLAAIAAPTITDSSAVTVTHAASFFVEGPPVQAGSATITNLYSVRADGTFSNTAGTGRGLSQTCTFAPSSGSGGFVAHDVQYTINQTGGSSGSIYGLKLRATQTAVGGTHKIFACEIATDEIASIKPAVASVSDMVVAFNTPTEIDQGMALTLGAGSGTGTPFFTLQGLSTGNVKIKAEVTAGSLQCMVGVNSALSLIGNATGLPNAALFTSPAGASFGGGKGVVYLPNAGTVPSTNPSNGGVLYSEAGALKWRGSGGTVTTIAPA